MRQPNEVKTLVTFWGTRGSISTPGRITEKYGGNTPCVTVCHQETFVILDAGTGIRSFGLDLEQEPEKLGQPLSLHLFLSHTHWDHIQGLPFFQPANNKETRLTIYGSPYKESFLASILKGQMDYNYFPVSLSDFAADISIREISSEVIELGPITVDWQEQIYHPGGSVRYRLSVGGKKIVYATDVELNQIFCGGADPARSEAQSREYLDFVQGADLLIADGQYTEEEYLGKVGWGHSSVPLTIEVASRAKVKQLAFFHHDPHHSDRFLDELWMKMRSQYTPEKHGLDLFWAREGLTISV